jgi:calcineurin-like phosphoesterase family protein
MRNAFFTADTHFNHANIISYCQRPFASVEEMNEALIAKWNARVGQGDLVYHLGDLAWGDWNPILSRLNGDIILIRGGHDKKSEEKFAGRLLHKADLMDIVIEGYALVLCHYCLRVWNKSHYDSWHLFGHSHGRLAAIGKSLDVGVDGHDFAPWSWEEVKAYMSGRPHNENFLGLKKNRGGQSFF